MAVCYQNIDVEIDLSDISDDDLIQELNERSISASFTDRTLIYDIWLKRRMGKDYQADLDQLIYNFIGKII